MGYIHKMNEKNKILLNESMREKEEGEKVKESKKADREKPMGLMEAKERDSRKRKFRERKISQ